MRLVRHLVAGATRCAIAIVILAAVPHARAQGYAVVEQARVSVVPRLAGHVAAGITEEPVADVRVELCSPEWKTVLKSIKTDRNGDFSFGTGSNGELFYLRLSSPGFDPYQFRIRIDTHAKSKLVIHLVVAT